MVTTNNDIFGKRIELLRSHNLIKSKNYWDYDIIECSYNYRLSDINCALGVSQLKKIQKFIKKRIKIYKYYQRKIMQSKHFGKLINLPKYENINYSSHHLLLINFAFKKAGVNKNIFIKYLNKNKIFPQFHYKPINMFSFYKKKISLPKSIKYFNSTISMPIYYSLKKKEIDFIVKKINSFF